MGELGCRRAACKTPCQRLRAGSRCLGGGFTCLCLSVESETIWPFGSTAEAVQRISPDRLQKFVTTTCSTQAPASVKRHHAGGRLSRRVRIEALIYGSFNNRVHTSVDHRTARMGLAYGPTGGWCDPSRALAALRAADAFQRFHEGLLGRGRASMERRAQCRLSVHHPGQLVEFPRGRVALRSPRASRQGGGGLGLSADRFGGDNRRLGDASAVCRIARLPCGGARVPLPRQWTAAEQSAGGQQHASHSPADGGGAGFLAAWTRIRGRCGTRLVRGGQAAAAAVRRLFPGAPPLEHRGRRSCGHDPDRADLTCDFRRRPAIWRGSRRRSSLIWAKRCRPSTCSRSTASSCVCQHRCDRIALLGADRALAGA